VLVEGVAVALTAGMTVDQVGAAIQAKENEIIAANDDITNVDYNTATDTLTFTYSVDAGDADDVSIIDSSNVDIHYEYTQQTGALGGSMTLDNMQTGGTLELNGGNDGETIVNLATDGANDSFNIILNDGIGSSDGLVHLAGIETLNVSQLDTDQFGHRLGLDAADATTVTVTGEAGVLFNNDFASLTSFDASGVTGTGDMGAVSVVTNADADTSLTGGAGDDSLTGSDQADDSDTINGGAGDDALFGRAGDDNLSGGDGDDDLTGGLGIDNMSGGAGNDTFHFNVVGDSQGVTVDNIADFISGEDTIDLSAIEQGTGSYAGEANGYGAVLTTLSGAATGDSLAVLDTSTSTLYVDVNGDGVLNDFDMAIDITGITNLEASDLAW
jgi:Ca2+-binding RTX toxin-like protein